MKLRTILFTALAGFATVAVVACSPEAPRLKHHFVATKKTVYHFKNGNYAYQGDDGVWWWFYFSTVMDSSRTTPSYPTAVVFSRASTNSPGVFAGGVRSNAPTKSDLEEAEVEEVDVAVTDQGLPLSPNEVTEVQSEAAEAGVAPNEVAEAADEGGVHDAPAAEAGDAGTGGDAGGGGGDAGGE